MWKIISNECVYYSGLNNKDKRHSFEIIFLLLFPHLASPPKKIPPEEDGAPDRNKGINQADDHNGGKLTTIIASGLSTTFRNIIHIWQVICEHEYHG